MNRFYFLVGIFCLIAVSAASATPVLHVDLNVDKPGIQSERTAVVGETFQIVMVLENTGTDPLIIDEAVLGVFYNDQEGGVLGVTPTVYPHASDLAETDGTIDYFSRKAVRAGDALTLQPIWASELPGTYKNAAGQAGIANYQNLFTLQGGESIAVAAGKLNAGFRALTSGASSVLATGPDGGSGFWLDGGEIVVEPSPGHVTVLPQQ